MTRAVLLLVLVTIAAGENVRIRRRASGKGIPLQEEADCPSGCRCDRNTVTCRDRHFKSTSVFQQLHPLAFPHLDTLVLTGNDFGDMATSLFGDGEKHGGVSSFNLTANEITKISRETFSATPNVEYLFLAHNKLKSVERSPFADLHKLRILDLRRALAPKAANSQADLLALMFETDKRSFIDLQEIDLSYNDLEKIHPDTFCKVEGLSRLLLAGNRLSKFEVAPKCLKQLRQLVLADNLFTTVPSGLFDVLPHFDAFDVSENPLKCDCELMPLVKMAREETNHFLNQGKTTCAAPSNYKGQNIFEFKGDFCESGSVLPHLILLSVVAVAVFVVYKHFRNRIPVPFQFGYQNLNAHSEENNRPEFV